MGGGAQRGRVGRRLRREQGTLGGVLGDSKTAWMGLGAGGWCGGLRVAPWVWERALRHAACSLARCRGVLGWGSPKGPGARGPRCA